MKKIDQALLGTVSEVIPSFKAVFALPQMLHPAYPMLEGEGGMFGEGIFETIMKQMAALKY